MSVSEGSTEDHDASEENGKGTNHHKRASAASLIEAFAQQYQADRQEAGRREGQRIFREWLTIIGLFLAAVVAAFQWTELRSTDHSIAEQAKIAARQLDEMREQRLLTVAQLRANLAPQETQHKPIKINDQILSWDVNPTFKNLGGTDATDVRLWWAIKFIEGSGLNSSNCPANPPPAVKVPATIIRRDGGITLFAHNLSALDVAKSNAGKGTVFIVGHIEYRDVFPDSPLRFFDWCWIALQSSQEGLSFVTQWQKAN